MAVGFIRCEYIYYNNNNSACCGPEIKATLVIIRHARADGKHNLQMEISAAPLARTRRPVAAINYMGVTHNNITRPVTHCSIVKRSYTVERYRRNSHTCGGRVNGEKLIKKSTVKNRQGDGQDDTTARNRKRVSVCAQNTIRTCDERQESAQGHRDGYDRYGRLHVADDDCRVDGFSATTERFRGPIDDGGDGGGDATIRLSALCKTICWRRVRLRSIAILDV